MSKAASSPSSASLASLILVPGLITLGVTLLRLAGELGHWSPALFSRQAGGAGALIGIVWLVPIFGWYFAAKLGGTESAPSGGRVLGRALLALLLAVAAGAVAAMGLHKGPAVVLPVIIVAMLVGSWIVWAGWPALSRTLFCYGLAARVPVMAVMLVAMLKDWGTHYDAAPPGFPADTPVMAKWFQIGVIPQLFLWIPFTIIIGAVLGGVALLLTGAKRR